MRILIGCRSVIDHSHVKETEALEICTPAVMAVDCSRGLACGKIHDELVRVMELMADCGNHAIMVKTEPAGEWTTLIGDAVKCGIKNLAKRLSETNDGELYITLPGCTYTEIYKIEEV